MENPTLFHSQKNKRFCHLIVLNVFPLKVDRSEIDRFYRGHIRKRSLVGYRIPQNHNAYYGYVFCM